MKKFVFFVIMAITLGGCATSGPKYSQYESTISPVSAEKARLYFFRQSKFAAGGVDAPIYVNGEEVGEAANKSYFFADVTPGRMVLKTESKMAPGVHVMETDVEAGNNYYIEVQVNEAYISSGVVLGLIGQSAYVASHKNSSCWLFQPTPTEEAIPKLKELAFSKD